jgi:hypothetical protein
MGSRNKKRKWRRWALKHRLNKVVCWTVNLLYLYVRTLVGDNSCTLVLAYGAIYFSMELQVIFWISVEWS